MTNVIPLNDKFYACCPECGGQEWLIRVNGPGNSFDEIMGTECKYCSFYVDWIKIRVN